MEFFVGLLALALVIYYLFFYARDRQPGTTMAAASATAGVPRIRGNDKYEVDVVGESFYEDAYRALLGQRLGDESTIECDATLVLEDSNPHDKNAVAVYIDGHKVGHLARDMAVDFRKALKRDGLGHLKSVAVGAAVFTGDEDGSWSVSLDLPQK